MTEDEHRLLIEVRDLAQENNRILKSLQRSNRAALAFKIVYWIIIIGVSFGALYLFQPYVDALKGSVSTVQEDPSTAAEPFTFSGAYKSIEGLKDLLK